MQRDVVTSANHIFVFVLCSDIFNTFLPVHVHVQYEKVPLLSSVLGGWMVPLAVSEHNGRVCSMVPFTSFSVCVWH